MTWARTLGKAKYRDGRRNNGGARVGAGRPIKQRSRKAIEAYLAEEIIVKEFRHGQIRRVKKPVLIAVLDELRNRALKHGDLAAIKLYFDITLGKAQVDNTTPRYRPKTVVKAIAMTGAIK